MSSFYWLRCLRAVLILAYLSTTIIPPLLLVFAAYVLVRPFNEGTYIRLASAMQSSSSINLIFFLEVVLNIQIVVSGDGLPPPGESALVMSNHLTHDWVPMYMMSYRLGTLSYVRTVMKKVSQYVPLFGWAMWLGYWPFISRSFDKDKKILTDLFQRLAVHRIPIQLWMYPEGTRRSRKKIDACKTYAATKPELASCVGWDHVLIPKHRGFMLAYASLAKTVSSVYDVTLQYEGWKGAASSSSRVPGFWDIATGDPTLRHVVHVHIERLRMSDIAGDAQDDDRVEGKVKSFLIKRFWKKEQLLRRFEQCGYFGPRRSPCLRGVPLSALSGPMLLWCVITVVFYYSFFWLVL